jgi:hypothetical protein
MTAVAAASPRHLQFIMCVDGQKKKVVSFPYPQRGVTVGSVWTSSQHKTGFVTVAINMNPPPEEQLYEDDDDNIALCSSNDEDSDF